MLRKAFVPQSNKYPTRRRKSAALINVYDNTMPPYSQSIEPQLSLESKCHPKQTT
jgi:hypothetical protein